MAIIQMDKKVFCFGELLLRMSPEIHGEWIRNANMPVYIGGAELNVASALAKWNVPVKYCTSLPYHYLSKEICDYLVKRNIDISDIIFSGNRIGVYYLSGGSDLKHSGVIYDRLYSSFSELQPGSIDWDTVLDDVHWFHFSAISPALNENIASLCKEALIAAGKKGITISVDLNYRSKLWQYGKQPVEIMPSLVEHCNVIMGNIWSANNLLAIDIDEEIHGKKSKEMYLEHSSKTAAAIMMQFPGCKVVANTFRFDNGASINYYAAVENKSGRLVSQEFSTTSVVDKVGSGDCFMAGLIYGLDHEYELQHVIDFSAAAAFGKLQEAGDATNQTVESIESKIHRYG